MRFATPFFLHGATLAIDNVPIAAGGDSCGIRPVADPEPAFHATVVDERDGIFLRSLFQVGFPSASLGGSSTKPTGTQAGTHLQTLNIQSWDSNKTVKVAPAFHIGILEELSSCKKSMRRKAKRMDAVQKEVKRQEAFSFRLRDANNTLTEQNSKVCWGKSDSCNGRRAKY